MNQQTRSGLAPKSWGAVAVWLVLLAVFVSRPGDSLALAFSAVRGTGQWLGYTAFAGCDETPPMEWMEPKQCPVPPDEPAAGAGTPATIITVPPALPELPGSVDGDDIRQALDAGTREVTELHGRVVEAQQTDAFVFRYGATTTDEGAGS